MTTNNDYLYEVLNNQNLDPGGPEMKALQEERKKVEDILRKKFGYSATINYGGSKAKGTMDKEAYDLDIIQYFPRDDKSAGETLEEIYNNTRDALSEDYWVEPKGSALRLTEKMPDPTGKHKYTHIDVVPGRYIDGNDGDVFLYRPNDEKHLLKTNLDVHIAHVKDSDVVDAIRLNKLWRVRNYVQIKNFALDLLTIKLLKNKKSLPLADQLVYIWTEFRDHSDGLCIEDPANPYGNDLSEMLNDSVKQCLKDIATSTLATLETYGWEAVFGQVERTTDIDKKASLERVAAAMPRSSTSKPWSYG
jgi:hypothetical protein